MEPKKIYTKSEVVYKLADAIPMQANAVFNKFQEGGFPPNDLYVGERQAFSEEWLEQVLAGKTPEAKKTKLYQIEELADHLKTTATKVRKAVKLGLLADGDLELGHRRIWSNELADQLKATGMPKLPRRPTKALHVCKNSLQQRLGISKVQLQHWIDQNKIPAPRIQPGQHSPRYTEKEMQYLMPVLRHLIETQKPWSTKERLAQGFYSRSELARAANLSVTTVDHHIETGLITKPEIKLPRIAQPAALFYSKEQFDEALLKLQNRNKQIEAAMLARRQCGFFTKAEVAEEAGLSRKEFLTLIKEGMVLPPSHKEIASKQYQVSYYSKVEKNEIVKAIKKMKKEGRDDRGTIPNHAGGSGQN